MTTHDQPVTQLDNRSAGDHRDRARWGPIWAGALIAVSTFLVLQSFFFAVGWLDLGFDGSSSAAAASVVSGILALIAFFIGGLAAAALAVWRGAESGLWQGALVWALTVVGMLLLSLLGGGVVFASVTGVIAALGDVQQQLTQGASVDLGAARAASGWSALFLGLSFLTAALGGLAGSKIWPGRRGPTVDR